MGTMPWMYFGRCGRWRLPGGGMVGTLILLGSLVKSLWRGWWFGPRFRALGVMFQAGCPTGFVWMATESEVWGWGRRVVGWGGGKRGGVATLGGGVGGVVGGDVPGEGTGGGRGLRPRIVFPVYSTGVDVNHLLGRALGWARRSGMGGGNGRWGRRRQRFSDYADDLDYMEGEDELIRLADVSRNPDGEYQAYRD